MRTFLGLAVTLIAGSLITFAGTALAQDKPEPLPSNPAAPPAPTDSTATPPPAPEGTPTAPQAPSAHVDRARWHEHEREQMHDHWGPSERPWLGGIAFFSVGYVAGDFSALQTSLGAPNSLGAGYDTAPAGIMFGGGGGFLIGPAWIGGKGFGLHVATTPHGSADTSLTAAGGGGELGFAAIASDRWLVVPYIGLGGVSYNLNVKNKTNIPLPVYTGEAVPAGGASDFTASLLTGEVGVRVNRLVLFGEGTVRGGLTLGAELGYMSALTRDAWVGPNAAGPESASIRGAYFRLVIGGGAMFFKKD